MFGIIIDSHIGSTHIKEGGAFIHMSNVSKRRIYNTKEWEVIIKWKYGSSAWNQVKGVKESLKVQLADYAVLNQIAEEPEFA